MKNNINGNRRFSSFFLAVLLFFCSTNSVKASDVDMSAFSITSSSFVCPDLPSGWEYYLIGFYYNRNFDSSGTVVYTLLCSNSPMIIDTSTVSASLTGVIKGTARYNLTGMSESWTYSSTTSVYGWTEDMDSDDTNDKVIIYANYNVEDENGDTFFYKTTMSNSLTTTTMFSPMVQYLRQLVVSLIPIVMIILVFMVGFKKLLTLSRRLLAQ